MTDRDRAAKEAAVDQAPASDTEAKPRARKKKRRTEARPQAYRALGLEPKASFQEVVKAHRRLRRQAIEAGGRNEARILSLDRAFREIRRHHYRRRKIASRRSRSTWRRSTVARLAMGAAAIAATFVLVPPLLMEYRVRTEEVSIGDQLFLRDSAARFGKVVAVDPEHTFRVGPPTPSFRVQLADSGRAIWISRQTVLRSMQVTSSK